MSGNEAAKYPLVESQRTATIAGFLYLLTMVTANFAEFYVRGRLVVAGNAVQTAINIAGARQLFQIGVASDVFTLAASVALLVALYLILKPVNRAVALLAALWWLVECSVGVVVAATAFASSLLLNQVELPVPFNAYQWQAMDVAGNRIAGIFFGLGSIAFCYLWFKSRCIPRWLAGWGVLASLLPILAQSSALFNPFLAFQFRRARSGIPIMIFEVVLGLWLLIKGIKTPPSE